MRADACRATSSSVGATVLIVDDHAGFRSFARALLEAEGFDVLGEAADGASALGLAQQLAPELVLLDVALPDMDGFAVCDALLGVGVIAHIAGLDLPDGTHRGVFRFVDDPQVEAALCAALTA
jgi:CheY-like chemotaxis protein